MTYSQPLQCDTLTLSPITAQDRAFVLALTGDPQVRAYLGGVAPLPDREAQFEMYLRGHPRVGIWIIRLGDGLPPAGLVVLSPHQDGGSCELSYQLCPQSWGQGIATRAVGRVAEYALGELGLGHVLAETQAANAASCRLLARLGFVELNRLERHGALQVVFEKT